MHQWGPNRSRVDVDKIFFVLWNSHKNLSYSCCLFTKFSLEIWNFVNHNFKPLCLATFEMWFACYQWTIRIKGVLEGRWEGRTQCSSFHVLFYFWKINNFWNNILQDAWDIYDNLGLKHWIFISTKVSYKSTKVNVPKWLKNILYNITTTL
jgi:hypothetical protein